MIIFDYVWICIWTIERPKFNVNPDKNSVIDI